MDANKLNSINYAEAFMEAFPVDEDAVTFEHAGTTMRSTFRICRLCGGLVLDSMTATHIRTIHTGKANTK